MSTTASSLDGSAIAGNGSLFSEKSESAASPRVSTVGGTDEPHVALKNNHSYQHVDFSAAVGLDHVHWGGVHSGVSRKRSEMDQRSVASSVNAEKDDKSVYEEPAVGAVEGMFPFIQMQLHSCFLIYLFLDL